MSDLEKHEQLRWHVANYLGALADVRLTQREALGILRSVWGTKGGKLDTESTMRLELERKLPEETSLQMTAARIADCPDALRVTDPMTVRRLVDSRLAMLNRIN